MSFLLCVSFPPACVPGYGGSSSSAAFHYNARCWCVSTTQRVHPYVVNLRAWVSAPHAQLDTRSSASTSPDSPMGGIGLAANGAGPRRCTAGVTPASTRTRDRRTDARTALCSRNGRHPSFPGVTWRQQAGHPREDPLTASSGRLPERGGDGTPRRVPGSDQPQSSCFTNLQVLPALKKG